MGRIYSICLLSVLLFTQLWSQDVTGNLEGWIVDSLDNRLSDVNITVSGSTLQGKRGAASDKWGHFSILRLPVGLYSVTLTHVSYQPLIFEDVKVDLGRTTTLGEITLAQTLVEIEGITVEANKAVIDPSSTASGINLDISTLEPLPLARNYQQIATLAPQANTSYYFDPPNISGSTGTESVYFIDGANVTDPVNAFRSTKLPYNFVREVQIKTAGYEAEYASSLGGIVNTVTRSGGNVLHGQVFGFFTNDALSQERRLTPLEEQPEGLTQYDIGFSLAGPIQKDRLWFYIAYNPSVEIEDKNLFSLGTFRDKKTAHLFAGKLSWRPGKNANVAFNIFGDPSKHDDVFTGFSATALANSDVALITREQGGINMAVNADYTPTKNLLLEGSAYLVTNREKHFGSTERGRTEPLLIDFETGIFSGGFSQSLDESSSRAAMEISGTLFLGNHGLKAGLAYEDNTYDQSFDDKTRRTGIVFRFNDSTYTAANATVDGKVRNRIPAVFIQDSWRLSQRLRINAGLRYNAQYLIGDDGAVAQRITNQFQPRIGFIYQPGQLGSQKVFASFGRYYERIPLSFPSIYHLKSTSFVINYDHNPALDPSGGDTLDFSTDVSEEVENLRGQYTDELIVGYEIAFWKQFKFSVRGIYRNLGEVVEDAFSEEQGDFIVGNPGRGDLSFSPKLERTYTSLELILERSGGRFYNFRASYVLSRNRGNYPGLYDQDYLLISNANISPGNDFVELLENSSGLLPNNRTHVFKVFGSYHTNFGLSIGTTFNWQSGTPLNEYGASALGPFYNIFLQQRGTAGRLSNLWDLSFRFTYDLGFLLDSSIRPKLILDALNIASKRETVRVDQKHYQGVDQDGNQAFENPNYLEPNAFQAPMMLRLGMQVDF